MSDLNCCWHGTVSQFLACSQADWLKTVAKNYTEIFQEEPGDSQVDAWVDCFAVLQDSLALANPLWHEGAIIFEYLLPREGGRRPDVLLIAGDHILVLEFKRKVKYNEADLDQARNYARDIEKYHLESRGYTVIPYLVATRRTQPGRKHDGIEGLAPFQLPEVLNTIPLVSRPLDIQKWLNSAYVPLPSLIQAAVDIFNNRELPHIRRAASYGIPQSLVTLKAITARAKASGEHHVVFVRGVPGAGKTLLGLQTVYNAYAEDEPAVFLSGNGVLIDVLSYTLGNEKTLVKALKSYIGSHFDAARSVPTEHIVVFDEAQRAWEKDYTKNRHGIPEPEQLLTICNRIPDWCVLIALIGEGQEIHVGEEGGFAQWRDALKKSAVQWNITAPAVLSDDLQPLPHVVDNAFDLNQTLRSHLSVHVTTWIEHVLQGDFAQAQALYPAIQKSGFSIYVTNELELAKRYCRLKYAAQPQKTYGLIASSRATNLVEQGVYNDYNHTRNVHNGKWFCAPSDDPESCRQLELVVTEFGCQGLELDMPVVCWGNDLRWMGSNWQSSGNSKAKDPHKLRLNSYRVLLSRGRDGMILYFPPTSNMQSTYDALLQSGPKPLVMKG